EIDNVKNQFLAALNARPEIQYAISQFSPNFPQYELDVDIEKIKMAGFSSTDIFSALQGYYGGLYTTDFNKFGKQYRVMIQAKPEDRGHESCLDNIYVRSQNGEASAGSRFVGLKKVYGPGFVEHFSLLNPVATRRVPTPGYSTGDAIAAIDDVA